MLAFTRGKLLLALTITISVCAVLGVEFVGRVMHWPQPYSALFEYNKDTGYSNPQGASVLIRSGASIYTVNFDDEGILDRANGSPNIILIGDGVIAGVELKADERLARQIGDRVSTGVVNLSVTGYGTVQQVIALEKYINEAQNKPHAVVWVFNLSNDLVDNVLDWEGAGVPGANLREPEKILPPKLPNVFYRILRPIYLKSRFVYRLRESISPSFSLSSSTEESVVLPCHGTKDQACKMSIRVCAEAMRRLQKIVTENNIQVFGYFWTDIGHEPQYSQSELDNLKETIIGVSPFIHWIGDLQVNSERTVWDKTWLVDGTRHANARATSRMAEDISRIFKSH